MRLYKREFFLEIFISKMSVGYVKYCPVSTNNDMRSISDRKSTNVYI